MLQRGHSGDVCDLASTLCKYDLRVRRVRRGSISSGLLMCGGCVHSIMLLPRYNRCIIWRMLVFMSVVVIVWGSVGKFVV